MSSTGVNVLRYSALAFGVFYGFYHQRTITATQKASAAKHEYAHKQQLIEKAKAEFAKSKLPKAESILMDPEDPKFDLEAYLTKVAAENP